MFDEKHSIKETDQFNDFTSQTMHFLIYEGILVEKNNVIYLDYLVCQYKTKYKYLHILEILLCILFLLFAANFTLPR